jgi:hypothetical protein
MFAAARYSKNVPRPFLSNLSCYFTISTWPFIIDPIKPPVILLAKFLTADFAAPIARSPSFSRVFFFLFDG